MKTLKETIGAAEQRKAALWHFNVSEIVALQAVAKTAARLKLPVLIGVSEGERKFLGTRTVAALVHSLREEFSSPLFLNADHCHTLESIGEALEAGYDSVIFDGAQLSLEENMQKTREAVEYVKSTHPRVLVEGELGYIGVSSELFTEIPEGAATNSEELTSAEHARTFVQETKVDLFAPAVGNIHGMLREGANPPLDIDRIRAIKKAAGVPLVLHGGSGIGDQDFLQAMEAGISIVHISTELRKAWREGLEQALKEHPQEVAPYRILAPAFDRVARVVESRLRLFNRG